MNALALVRNMTADDVTSLSAQVDGLKRDALRDLAEIDRLETLKISLDDFDEVVDVNRKIERLRWSVARAQGRLPELENRLADAIDKARRDRLHKAVKAYNAAARKLLVAARAGGAAFVELTKIRQGASEFEGERGYFATAPHLRGNLLCASDLLDEFESTLDVIDARLRGDRTRPAVIQPAPKPKASPDQKSVPRVASSTNRKISLGESPNEPPSKRDRPLPAPVEGGVEIVILRDGVELANGTQAVVGDHITVDRKAAEATVRSGAADYVKTRSAPVQIEPKPATAESEKGASSGEQS